MRVVVGVDEGCDGVTRELGRSGIVVSEIGVGTWAIGGPFTLGGVPDGWGEVDDEESVRALRRAFDLGATLVDTADVYGAGHAERVVGQAVRGRRDDVVIATKWGYTFDEATRESAGEDHSPSYLRTALAGSLQRLDTDYIDILQLHCDVSPEEMDELASACEDLLDEGKIRAYGWSTDNPDRADALAAAGRACVVQHELNVLSDSSDMLSVCDRWNLASLNRSPLAMGLLSDRVTSETHIVGDDVRAQQLSWLRWFTDGRPDPQLLARRDAIRDILCSQGRNLAQGALAWILARSPRTIPIPGCRTVRQVEENLGTLQLPALADADLATIARLSTVATSL